MVLNQIGILDLKYTEWFFTDMISRVGINEHKEMSEQKQNNLSKFVAELENTAN